MRKNDLLVLLGCTVVFPGLYATSMSSNSHGQKHSHQSHTISTSQSQNMQVQQETWSSGKKVCTILASLLLLLSVGAWWLAGGLAFIISASCGTLGLLLSGISAFGFNNAAPSPAPVSQKNAQTNVVSQSFTNFVSPPTVAKTHSPGILSRHGKQVLNNVKKGKNIDPKKTSLSMSDVQEIYLVCMEAIKRLSQAHQEVTQKFGTSIEAVVKGYDWSAQFKMQGDVLHVKNGSSFTKDFDYEDLLNAWNAAKDNNHTGEYEENKKIYDAWSRKIVYYISNLKPLCNTLQPILKEHQDVAEKLQELNDVRQQAIDLQNALSSHSPKYKRQKLTDSEKQTVKEVATLQSAVDEAEKNLNKYDGAFRKALKAYVDAQKSFGNSNYQLNQVVDSISTSTSQEAMEKHTSDMQSAETVYIKAEEDLNSKEEELSKKKESFIKSINAVMEKYQFLVAYQSQKLTEAQDVGKEALSPELLVKYGDSHDGRYGDNETPEGTQLNYSEVFSNAVGEHLPLNESSSAEDKDVAQQDQANSEEQSSKRRSRSRRTLSNNPTSGDADKHKKEYGKKNTAAKQNRPSSAKKSANTTRIGRGQHAQSAKSS